MNLLLPITCSYFVNYRKIKSIKHFRDKTKNKSNFSPFLLTPLLLKQKWQNLKPLCTITVSSCDYPVELNNTLYQKFWRFLFQWLCTNISSLKYKSVDCNKRELSYKASVHNTHVFLINISLHFYIIKLNLIYTSIKALNWNFVPYQIHVICTNTEQ